MESLESEPLGFGKSVEEHQAMPVETIANRFRAGGPGNFTLGAFLGDSLVGMATFIRETGLEGASQGSYLRRLRYGRRQAKRCGAVAVVGNPAKR